MKHLLKTIIVLIAVAIWQTACAQEKETVYLIFEEGSEVNCVKIKSKSYKRGDTLRVKYVGNMMKRGLENRPHFFVCVEKFLLAKNSKIETIKTGDLRELNIVDFDYFIKKRFETNKVTKRSVFDKIYFLEKIDEDQYLKYEVYWNQSAHNRGI